MNIDRLFRSGDKNTKVRTPIHRPDFFNFLKDYFLTIIPQVTIQTS